MNQVDKTYMALAIDISHSSQDNRTKVGACIIKYGNCISVGCNNPPNGYDEYMTWELGKDLDNKHLYVVHAEANAIINAKKDLTDCVLYTTLFPCNECAKLIIQSGIKEIVYLENKFEDHITVRSSKLMLGRLGIKYRKYSEEN